MLREREPSQFALLAQAVAGRPVAVTETDSERSFTDGETIFLADLQSAALPASVVVQAALLAAGSLKPAVMTKIMGRRLVRLRYLTLEATRAASELGVVIPERVRTQLEHLYDGPTPRSAEESLAWAAGRRGVPEAPEWLGTIKPIRVLRTTPAGVGAAPIDEDLAGTTSEQPIRELDDEEESERSRILELFSAPIRNPLASMIQRFFGMGRAPGTGGGGAELPVGGSTFGAVGPNARRAQRPVLPGLGLLGAPIGRLYPEWDFRAHRYRPDWCSVLELDPPAPPPDEQPAPIPASDHRLRRALARLGLTHERHRRQAEGDSIDLTALVDLMVDRAAGSTGDPRVYETNRRTAHDLGVLVLLDATGSTGESSEGRKVFDEQRVLTARLTGALDEIGDRVATYAFYSRGRHAVRFLRVKDFDDRYDHAARRRLQALAPGGYTRLGAAIRHATHVLSDRAGTSIRLLVLVGDGLPYEDGYEHRYAQEDSHRALREAVGRGVGCACVGVRTSTSDDVLERVWGGVPHVRLGDPADMHTDVRQLFGAAIKAAAASRRSIGRTAPLAAVAE